MSSRTTCFYSPSVLWWLWRETCIFSYLFFSLFPRFNSYFVCWVLYTTYHTITRIQGWLKYSFWLPVVRVSFDGVREYKSLHWNLISSQYCKKRGNLCTKVYIHMYSWLILNSCSVKSEAHLKSFLTQSKIIAARSLTIFQSSGFPKDKCISKVCFLFSDCMLLFGIIRFNI